MVNQKVLDAISVEMMEQYECVRQSGVTDMYDRMGVVQACVERRFVQLGLAVLDEYTYALLLMNHGKLMKHYGITQEVRDDSV